MTGRTALRLPSQGDPGVVSPFVDQTAVSFLWSRRSHDVVRSGRPDRLCARRRELLPLFPSHSVRRLRSDRGS
jgi:hypothetical protein